MTAPETRSWQTIRDEVLRRIHSREWRPGDLIPSEADLAAEFGCARATVNRALRELADTGLLERRRKAGTRVAPNPVRKATLSIPVTRLEIEARGAAYAHVLLGTDRATPPPHVQGVLRLPSGTRLLHIRALHMADGRPYAYEDRWVNPDAVPAILTADLDSISANEWLVANAPFSDGSFTFLAESADAELAKLLDCAEGTALIVIERTTWDGATPITAVRLHYRPGHRLQAGL